MKNLARIMAMDIIIMDIHIMMISNTFLISSQKLSLL